MTIMIPSILLLCTVVATQAITSVAQFILSMFETVWQYPILVTHQVKKQELR